MSTRAPLSDNARMYVSTFVGVAIALGAMIVIALATGQSIRDSGVLVLTYLLFWPISTVIFILWSSITYSRVAQEQLVVMVRAESVSRKKWWYFMIGSGGAASWTITGAILSITITAVTAQLPEVRGSGLFLGLAFVTVAAAWALMVFGFAMSYHQLALAEPDEGHFEFQMKTDPTFDDYLTLACLFSVMGASAPAEMRTSRAWRLVRTNVLLAFAFNSVIVAMVVSIVVSSLTS